MLLVTLFGSACGATTSSTRPEPRDEDDVSQWSAEARARIESAIAAHGRSSATFDAARPPVAVFDWDNTTMRGDIGDLTFALALERGLLRVPRDGFGALEPLTPAATAALERACGRIEPLGAVGADTECGAWLAHVALEGRTPAGDVAFERPFLPTSRASYAFLGQLFGGLGPAEIGALGREAFELANARPLGTMLRPGGVEIEGFARIQPPIRALVHTLRDAGFEAWVVSASHQAIVENIAEEAGFERDHVIGLRPAMASGLYTIGWEDPASDGDVTNVAPTSAVPVINFHEGKRAWIQRVIFGMRGVSVLRADPVSRPVLAFGDADTDLAMLESASALAVLFDRHQVRVTCRALAAPARYVVHPLFVAPPPPRTEPYPCSSLVDGLGAILDELGEPIPDQTPP